MFLSLIIDRSCSCVDVVDHHLFLLRSAPQVDTNFFLSTTPIEQFESTFLVNTFPRANRIDVLQTRDDIKTQLNK